MWKGGEGDPLGRPGTEVENRHQTTTGPGVVCDRGLDDQTGHSGVGPIRLVGMWSVEV